MSESKVAYEVVPIPSRNCWHVSKLENGIGTHVYYPVFTNYWKAWAFKLKMDKIWVDGPRIYTARIK